MRRFDSCCSCIIRLFFSQVSQFRRRPRFRKLKCTVSRKQWLKRSLKKILKKASPVTIKAFSRLHILRLRHKLSFRTHKKHLKKSSLFAKIPRPVLSLTSLRWASTEHTSTFVISLSNFLWTDALYNLSLKKCQHPHTLDLLIDAYKTYYKMTKFSSKFFLNDIYFLEKAFHLFGGRSWESNLQKSFKNKYPYIEHLVQVSSSPSPKKYIQALQTLHYFEFFNQIYTPLSALFRKNYEQFITYKVPMPSSLRFYYYRIDRSQQSTNFQTSRSLPKSTSFTLNFPTLTLNTLLLNNWLLLRQPTLLQALTPLTISSRQKRRIRRQYWRKWLRSEFLKWEMFSPVKFFSTTPKNRKSSLKANVTLRNSSEFSFLLNNSTIWNYLKTSPLLVKYFFEVTNVKKFLSTGLLLKVLARTVNSDSSTQLLLANLVPALQLKYTIYRRILRVVGYSKFTPNVVPYYHYTLIQFLENLSGKRVYIKFNPFIENSLTFLDLSRCIMWEQRVMGFKRILGPKIFLNESLRLIYLAIKNKDSMFLVNWIKAMLYRMSFWKYRLIFRYLRYVIRVLFRPYFLDLNFKGLKVKLKGKISIAGNGRTRTLMYRVGQTSNSKFNNRVNYTFTLVHTFTGVLGFQLWFYF